jgi:hypothetical protein
MCSWIFTTKLQAIRDEIKGHHPDDYVSPEIAEKALKTLQSLEKKNRRAK